MGHLVWAQGQVKVAKKCENTPTCDVPPANAKPKTKIFRCQLEDLLNP